VKVAGALRGRKAVAVIDQNLSVGFGGITHAEIASALYAEEKRPPILSFVGALGGKDISTVEFDQIAEDMQNAHATGVVPPPRMLYTNADETQMRGFLRLAGKGVPA
jgi:pyruvate ferredoxin oxidoreductase alpha subunit